ncbi:PAS domain S-box protein [Oleiharenicola lentus]|uniref:PAS domain S-box protein n=1 Tax=Oleiharenicola lentus TaxID=2508720 RepID=UPI003F67B127
MPEPQNIQQLHLAALSVMAVGVYTCDVSGRITFFNRRVAELWAREPKADDPADRFLAGGKLYQTDGEVIRIEETPMAVAARTGTSFRELELIYERVDGVRFFASLNIEVMRDASGVITGVVTSFQDVSDRKRHENVLLQLSKRMETQAKLFDTTLSNLTDLTYAFSQDGRFLYANRPLLAMLGKTLEEVVGRSLYDLNYPNDVAERLLSEMNHVFNTGETIKSDIVIALGEGREEHHEYIYNPVKDEAGRVVAMAGSTRIITERRRTEDRIKLLAELVEKADASESPDEIIRFISRKVGEHLQAQRCLFCEWDANAERVNTVHDWHVAGLASIADSDTPVDYGPSAWVQQLTSGPVSVPDVEVDVRLRGYAQSHRKNGVRSLAVSRYLRQETGGVTLFVTSGEVRKWTDDELGFLSEVVMRIWPSVERARAMQASRAGEQRYRELVQSMPVAVYTNDIDGRIQLYNEAAVKLWGRVPVLGKAEFWCGSEMMFTNAGLQIRHADSPMARAVLEKRTVREEIVIRRPTGQMRYVIVNSEVTRDATGEVTGAVNVVIDITDRKREEQRSAFLHQLSNQLALLNDEAEIIRVTTAELGKRLNADRCYFVECHEVRDVIIVSENWLRDPNKASLAGSYALSQFGDRKWWNAYASGNFRVEDVTEHPLTQATADPYLKLGVRSYAVQPFREKGAWQTVISVTEKEPRAWTDDEMAIMEDVVARVWPMVQRARAMAALRHSENDLRFALDAAQLGSWEWEIDTGILRSSDRCKINFGLSVDADFVDGDYSKSILAADRPGVNRTIEQAIKNRTVYETEYRVVWPDGKIHWILERGQGVYDENGKTLRVVGLNLDITERKATEQSLRNSAERLQLALDAAKLGIWSWDAATDRLETSPRMDQIMGIPAGGEFQRAKLRELLHPDDRERSRIANEHAMATHTDYDEEYRLHRDDGRNWWISSKGRGIYDAEGKPIGMLGVVQDISARKSGEKYLRQQRDVLEQVLKSTSLAEIMKSLVQQVESLAERRLIAAISLLDEQEKTLRPVTGLSVPADWNRYIDFLKPSLEAGSFGAAVFTGRPVTVDIIATSPLWRNLREEAARHGFKACWSTPIVSAGGNVLGAFSIYYFEHTEPTQHELEIVDIVVRTVSIAIERRRNEAAMRNSEERLRLATATGKVGVWDWDIAANRITWSDSVYKIYGITPDQFDRTLEGFARFVHPEDRNALSHAFEMATRTGQSFELEHRSLRADGRLVWLFTNANVLRENGVALRLTGATLDITERKRAEEALRVKEQQLSLVAGTAPILLTQCDSDERFTFANRAYLEKRGLSSSEVIGHRISEVLDQQSYRSVKPYIDQVLRGEKVVFEANLTYRGEVRTMEANYVPEIDANGKVKGWVAAVSDVTERKRVHDAVRQLAAIVESSDDAIISRTLDGRIMSWNRGAERLFGYAAAEILGESVMTLIPVERHGEEFEIIGKIRKNQNVEHYETKRLHKDGTMIDISLSVSPIRDEHGHVVGASKIARNITQQKRYEAQLEAAQVQLQAHAQNLEQKVTERTAALREAVTQMEEFSYTVSHDLRAPLRAMNSYSQALMEDYGPQLDATAKEYLNRIQRSSQRMEQLTHDVLMYSRLVRSEVVLVNLNLENMVLDAIDQFDVLQQPKAQVEIVSPLGHVIGHEVSLGQCLANLMTNAVKFVAPGVKPHVRVVSEKRESRVRLWIEDNGIGIAPEHQAKIFMIFERLHGREQYEGTGMGLAIVRKAMEKMGGSCGVESTGKDGSRFWLELPQAPSA